MEQYVYSFGLGKADGNGGMKDTLGGKGAGLAEMTNAGLPVPPGFTISTDVCRMYYDAGRRIPEVAQSQIAAALARLEAATEQKLGDAGRPLLVSVRSGAKFSMPGMMDTVLNLGLNDTTVEAMHLRTGNERFAWDSYRRFIQMFGNVVLGIPKDEFEHALSAAKKKARVTADTGLTAADLKRLVTTYKAIVQKFAKTSFPQDPVVQLQMAIEAVFGSWNNDRAVYYRKSNNIPENLGTAVNVQAMVFGNMGDTSGTGVGFTRDPATGEKEFYGEYLMNAQGEDVVAGVRTPLKIATLRDAMPDVYEQLREITTNLEKHYRDMQDFEFTIQEGKLYMLQTRNGKRGGRAAVRIAVDMVEEGLISVEEAVLRVDGSQLEQVLRPILDPNAKYTVLAKAIGASSGAFVGHIVFSAADAVRLSTEKYRTILVRKETVPDDIRGMEAAGGILTSRGGATSHAAVVARGMGKTCVVGAGAIDIDEAAKTMTIGKKKFKEGDFLTLDGSAGRVIEGAVATVDPDPNSPEFVTLMKWVDSYRKLHVRANADVPVDAQVARAFGAEGIGLCRTEHMFFAEGRMQHVQAMIMADTVKDRRAALKNLLPFQRSDFEGLFKAMNGLPVTIRLLDPPLHEFLPKREELMVEVAVLREKSKGRKTPAIKKKEELLARVESLHEFNPMLGHRGCRLGITHAEISEMQCRAIFEAACNVKRKGVTAKPEIMIPLVGIPKEFEHQKEIVDRVAKSVFEAKGEHVDYIVGTMIELPRACVVADKIAKHAEFFSFGTNDLTQTAFGFSRDDANKFTPAYTEADILKSDPFQVLDQDGVGALMRIGIEKGRAVRPNLKLGICGEHGGEPSSVEFCHRLGLDYVSCSPYRVPIARLAAAHAALASKSGERSRTV